MVTFHQLRQSLSRSLGLTISLLIVVGCLSAHASVVEASTTYYPLRITSVNASTSPTGAVARFLMPSLSEVNARAGGNGLKANFMQFKVLPDSVVSTDLSYRCLNTSGGSGSWAFDSYDIKQLNANLRQLDGTGSGFADCTTVGDYYVTYRDLSFSTSTVAWVGVFHYNGTGYTLGTTTGTTTDSVDFENSEVLNTRFILVKANSFATGTVTITARYYLDPNEVDRTNSLYNPTQVKYTIAKRPATTTSAVGQNISATSTGYGTSTNAYSGLSAGTYEVLVTFSNGGCSIGLSLCPFPDSYSYITFDVNASGTLIANTQFIEYYDSLTPTPDQTYEKQLCNLTNLSGCISNAFAFLFIPSDASLARFTTLNNTLSTKFPFAYAYDFSDTVSTLYTTTATESGTLTVPFGTFGDLTLISESQLSAIPFASTLKTLLSYILWIMFMIAMYRRTLTIFNPTPA